MGRLLAIDYGKKRTGLAVSDPSRIIATALTTVETSDLFNYLKQYVQEEQVDTIVVGYPRNMDNTPAEVTADIEKVAQKLGNIFPEIEIVFEDERFTSKMAMQSMVQGGVPKGKRKEKGRIDRVSAVIILQGYMERIK